VSRRLTLLDSSLVEIPNHPVRLVPIAAGWSSECSALQSAYSPFYILLYIVMEIRRRPPNPAISVASLEYKIQAPDAEPRNILEKIVWHKETEVARQREAVSLQDLQKQVQGMPMTKGFVAALREQAQSQGPAVIAEVKKASPTKGVIREDFDPVAIARSYEAGGATCLSVLTDSEFFQGSFEYLRQIRQAVTLPLLCKEFVIYPYQIYQARAAGADAVLLIAAILSDKDLNYFVRIARALGMAALVEVHTPEEFERALTLEGIELIGINNRNLEDFTVSLATIQQIMAAHPEIVAQGQPLIISESGLHTPEDVATVTAAGAQALLVGESFMKQPDPGQAIATLLNR
jgi:indole-3-glycerol phosphate synthase